MDINDIQEELQQAAKRRRHESSEEVDGQDTTRGTLTKELKVGGIYVQSNGKQRVETSPSPSAVAGLRHRGGGFWSAPLSTSVFWQRLGLWRNVKGSPSKWSR